MLQIMKNKLISTLANGDILFPTLFPLKNFLTAISELRTISLLIISAPLKQCLIPVDFSYDEIRGKYRNTANNGLIRARSRSH